jgi:4-amino-4-deoxy-L-arabinose transferase-like glycosyltransferase
MGMEGTDMTVLDDRPLMMSDAMGARPAGLSGRHPVVARANRPVARANRPVPARPSVAPLSYHGNAVPMSQAAHRRRPVSTSVTIALAVLAALITLWLGALAHLSGNRVAAPAGTADQLAVVQVQAGETLQQVARRVAPDAPVSQVVERIRALNKLDSVSVDVGQTLIAPIG